MVPRLVYQYEHQQALCQRSQRLSSARQAFVPSLICSDIRTASQSFGHLTNRENARRWNVALAQRFNSVQCERAIVKRVQHLKMFVSSCAPGEKCNPARSERCP